MEIIVSIKSIRFLYKPGDRSYPVPGLFFSLVVNEFTKRRFDLLTEEMDDSEKSAQDESREGWGIHD